VETCKLREPLRSFGVETYFAVHWYTLSAIQSGRWTKPKRSHAAVLAKIQLELVDQLVKGRDWSGHRLYGLSVDFGAAGLARAELILRLKERRMISQVHYIPAPVQPYFHCLGFRPEDYANAKDFYQFALSIPLFYRLADDQQKHVVETFRELVG
jgi:dTDP-4-amino-4,6-dideoxygalactose transaminase